MEKNDKLPLENPSHSFLITTRQRLSQIKDGLEKLRQDVGNKPVFEEMKLNFHKISGSSGVYGYPELGKSARKSELTLLEIEDGAIKLTDEILDQFEKRSNEMERLFQEILKRENLQEINSAANLKADGKRSAQESGQAADAGKPRILVVDDDETILALVEKHLLRAGYSMKTAKDGKSALEEVFTFSPDMIILDIMLPDIDGLDLLKIIRQRPGGNIIPIMFLTARDGLEDRIQGLSIGGDDYLTKPFFPEELVARVGALVARTAILKELAVKDGLTGVYNHRYFYEKLIAEITRWKRYGRQFTLALIDLDFFKNVNDTFGHVVGDLVLRQVADFLQGQLRPVDIVARYGGEEFALILAETDVKFAYKIMRRIYGKMKDWEICLPGSERKIRVTFSTGVATCPDDGIDERLLVSHADEALYEAKEGGRGQFILYRDLVKIKGCITEPATCVAEENGGKIIKKDGAIFIAEDDHLISQMLKVYLENEGYQIRVFPNGAELLAIVNLEKPDVIILDVMMPVMDGLKTLEIIKSQDDLRNIPVILLTSLDDSRIVEMNRNLEASDYIQKPFDPGVLAKAIDRQLEVSLKQCGCPKHLARHRAKK